MPTEPISNQFDYNGYRPGSSSCGTGLSSTCMGPILPLLPIDLAAQELSLLQGLAEIARLAGLEPISKGPAANAWKDLLSLPFS